jgi:hypothetical protein
MHNDAHPPYGVTLTSKRVESRCVAGDGKSLGPAKDPKLCKRPGSVNHPTVSLQPNACVPRKFRSLALLRGSGSENRLRSGVFVSVSLIKRYADERSLVHHDPPGRHCAMHKVGRSTESAKQA